MEEIIYQTTAALEEHHWWFLGRRRIIKKVLNDLALPNNAKILEVGCGTGGNLLLLSHYGEVFGIELDKFAREYAMKRGKACVMPGSLPHDIPYQDNFFDLIVLLDVLEHVEEDDISLVKLFNKLKLGGYLLITVPAFSYLWSIHDELHHHKRRYTYKSLETKIIGSGYKIIFHSYINAFLFPIIAALRLFKISRATGDLFMPPRLINTILFKIFSFECHLLNLISLPFGLSLLIVALKNPKLM